MKYVLLAVTAMAVSACSSLPFLDAKNQLESIVAVSVAGTYTVTVTKNGNVIVTETWVCTQDAGKLTGCHKQ